MSRPRHLPLLLLVLAIAASGCASQTPPSVDPATERTTTSGAVVGATAGRRCRLARRALRGAAGGAAALEAAPAPCELGGDPRCRLAGRRVPPARCLGRLRRRRGLPDAQHLRARRCGGSPRPGRGRPAGDVLHPRRRQHDRVGRSLRWLAARRGEPRRRRHGALPPGRLRLVQPRGPARRGNERGRSLGQLGHARPHPRAGVGARQRPRLRRGREPGDHLRGIRRGRERVLPCSLPRARRACSTGRSPRAASPRASRGS